MYCTLLSEIFSYLTTATLSQADDASILVSHDSDLRSLLINRLNLCELPNNCHQALSDISNKSDIKGEEQLTLVNACESPLSWIHTVYLSMS